jgi:hypothetical protein
MRHTISSAQTFLTKVVLPVLWIGGFAIATIVFFLGAGDFRDAAGNPPSSDAKWTFLLVTLVGGSFIYWQCVRLKRVALDDKVLFISNYAKEVPVPLRDIEDVTENRWLNTHPVTIHFHRDTEFGSSIVFMPKVRWFAFFSPHPVVAELHAAAARARGMTPDAPAA